MPLVTLSLLISIFLSVPGSGSGSAKLRALPVVLTGSGTFAFIYKKAAAETPPPLSFILNVRISCLRVAKFFQRIAL